MPIPSLALLLGWSTAWASPTTDALEEARVALVARSRPGAEAALDRAELAAPRSSEILRPSDLASIWVYRGIAGRMQGRADTQVLDSYRRALVLDMEMGFDEELWPGDDAIVFEALRREVRDRPSVEVVLPRERGGAVFFLDGGPAAGLDPVPVGTHLAQARCADGQIVGQWTQFERRFRWEALCRKHAESAALARDEASHPSEPPVVTAPAVEQVARAGGKLQNGPPKGSSSQEMLQRISEAETAFGAMDLPAFQQARLAASLSLASLAEPIDPSAAAAYHRLLGLEAFLARQEARAIASFHAAQAIHPSMQLPQSLAPPGNPLHTLWVRGSQESDGSPFSMNPPPGGILWVDGARRRARPSSRPAVVQLQDPASGRILRSWWLEPSQPDPTWPPLDATSPSLAAELASVGTLTPVSDPIGLPDPARLSRSKPRPGAVAMFLGGAAGLAASGALYAVALDQKATFMDPDAAGISDVGELDAQRRRTNSIAGASVGVGTAGLGLGLVGLFRWIL